MRPTCAPGPPARSPSSRLCRGLYPLVRRSRAMSFAAAAAGAFGRCTRCMWAQRQLAAPCTGLCLRGNRLGKCSAEVQLARVAIRARRVRTPKMPRRRRRRGTKHSVEAASEYAKALRDELQERVEWDEAKRQLATQDAALSSRMLFISNISFAAAPEALRQLLERHYGTVLGIQGLPHRQPPRAGCFSGAALAEFQAPPCMASHAAEDVLLALGVGHKGSIRVRRAQQRGPAGGSWSHHRSAGEHIVRVTQVDVGCLLSPPAGPLAAWAPTPMVSEWRSLASGLGHVLCVSLAKRCLRLRVLGPGGHVYLLESRFKHVRSLATTADGCLLYTLRLPPRVYRVNPAGGLLLGSSAKDVVDEVLAERASANSGGAGLRLGELQASLRALLQGQQAAPSSGCAFAWPPGLDDGDALVGGADDDERRSRMTDFTPQGSLGRCLTYRLQLADGVRLLGSGGPLARGLRDFGLLRRQEQLHVDVQVRGEGEVRLRAQQVQVELRRLPRGAAYLVNVLLSGGQVSIWSDVHALCAAIQQQQQQQQGGSAGSGDGTAQSAAAAAEGVLSLMADSREPILDPAAYFRRLLGSFQPDDDAPSPPRHCALVPWALVTPLRVRWMLARPEMSNRVLRHAASLQGFQPLDLVRVVFGDEHGDRLHVAGTDHDVVKRMAEVMLRGTELLGCTYEFLAYSSSQLKEQSYWAVAVPHANVAMRADSLRQWMGDFLQTIKVPAKCAARMGQCFSTTAASTDALAPWQACSVPDVSRNGYTFSDGVGLISPQLLLASVSKVPFAPADATDVSAIQVRFGGCKGVLALHPWLLGSVLHTRPSMEKFGSAHRVLEVVAIADAIPCFLNRHVVLLLAHHGVPTSAFTYLQDKMVHQLDRMLEDRAHAAALLPRLGCIARGCAKLLTLLLRGGVPPSEPFVQACLRAARAHLITGLRKKTRILVEQGVVLMGVMDELGVLQPEQVFLQTKDASGQWRAHVGRVLVAKHPVMHVGDVRMLEAVASLNLLHLKNVLVFSQHGARPVPSQLSGSDLDGDQYVVVWEPLLLLPRANSNPGSYAAAKPEALEQVQVHDLVRHFLNHALNDNLGQIANAWLVHADRKGAGCAECATLADMHSTAVDFPKTGVPAPPLLRPLSVAECPHWMQNKHKASYTSTSAVAACFDRLQGVPLLLPEPSAGAPRQPECDMGSFRVQGWEAYLEEAMEDRRWYDEKMMQIMARYSVPREGEALSGCVSKFHKLHKRRHHEVREQLGAQVRQLAAEARHWFLQRLVEDLGCGGPTQGDGGGDGGDAAAAEQAGEEDPSELLTMLWASDATALALRRKACAYYAATYRADLRRTRGIAAEGGPMPLLLSFPWVTAGDVLVEVKRAREGRT